MAQQRRARLRAFGPVSTIMSYARQRRRDGARQSRQGRPGASVFTHRPTPRASRAGGGGLSMAAACRSTARTGRKRPATARPCRSSCMAGQAAPGAARKWAASAACKHYMQRTAVQCQAEDARRYHGQSVPVRPSTSSRCAPLPTADRANSRSATPGRGLADRDDRRHRAFRGVHRRQILRPYGRGSGKSRAHLRRTSRARLSAPLLRRRAVRRSRSGTGARQYRPREFALPEAGLSR